jgi:hypothetical protein
MAKVMSLNRSQAKFYNDIKDKFMTQYKKPAQSYDVITMSSSGNSSAHEVSSIHYNSYLTNLACLATQF